MANVISLLLTKHDCDAPHCLFALVDLAELRVDLPPATGRPACISHDLGECWVAINGVYTKKDSSLNAKLRQDKLSISF